MSFYFAFDAALKTLAASCLFLRSLIKVQVLVCCVKVGTLMSAGMLLFCGSCYYHALTGSTVIRRVTPYGGMLLIAAWASMIL